MSANRKSRPDYMKRIKTLLFGFLGTVGFILLAVYWLPAALVYQLFQSRIQNIELQGISGSLWHGKAAHLIVRDVDIGSISWSLQPLSLIRRELNGVARVEGASIQAEGVFALREDVLKVQSVNAFFPALLLTAALDVPAIRPLGRVQINIQDLWLERGLPVRVTGYASWLDMGLAGTAEVQLPGIRMDFSTAEQGAIRGILRDLGGVLEAQGQLACQHEQCLTEVWLSLREEHPQLSELLKWVGQRAPDGRTYLRIDGNLKKLD